jgi:uncharacterized protein YpmB
MEKPKISKGLITIGIIVIIVLALYGSIRGAYNNMVQMEEAVEGQ